MTERVHTFKVGQTVDLIPCTLRSIACVVLVPCL